jgi:N-acetylglucosaminyldiphosphoundecaprenol N-acetyl-beta-D-mannosaminyltransferase
MNQQAVRLSDATDIPQPPVSNLFGIPVARVDMEQALDLVSAAISCGQRLDIGVVNAAKVVNMQSDDDLRASVLSSDVIFADGMSVVSASRLLGQPLPERVTGIDLMHGILRRGCETGTRVFCLGAEESVSVKVAEEIARLYPGVNLVGRRNGYYSDEEEASVADMVRDARAEVLFVAMTSPKKENFMARWGEHMGVTVCHGVGGSFDVVAGKVERAPGTWQALGMEWLYRLLQEPRRLGWRYLKTNVTFVMILCRELLRPRRD